MFWEENLNNLQLLIVFGIFGWPFSETHPDWLATEEAAAVEAVLWW